MSPIFDAVALILSLPPTWVLLAVLLSPKEADRG